MELENTPRFRFWSLTVWVRIPPPVLNKQRGVGPESRTRQPVASEFCLLNLILQDFISSLDDFDGWKSSFAEWRNGIRADIVESVFEGSNPSSAI